MDAEIERELHERARQRTGRLVGQLRGLADLTEELHQRGYIVASVGTRHDSSTNESMPIITIETPEGRYCGSVATWREWRHVAARMGLAGWE